MAQPSEPLRVCGLGRINGKRSTHAHSFPGDPAGSHAAHQYRVKPRWNGRCGSVCSSRRPLWPRRCTFPTGSRCPQGGTAGGGPQSVQQCEAWERYRPYPRDAGPRHHRGAGLRRRRHQRRLFHVRPDEDGRGHGRRCSERDFSFRITAAESLPMATTGGAKALGVQGQQNRPRPSSRHLHPEARDEDVVGHRTGARASSTRSTAGVSTPCWWGERSCWGGGAGAYESTSPSWRAKRKTSRRRSTKRLRSGGSAKRAPEGMERERRGERVPEGRRDGHEVRSAYVSIVSLALACSHRVHS